MDFTARVGPARITLSVPDDDAYARHLLAVRSGDDAALVGVVKQMLSCGTLEDKALSTGPQTK